MKKLIILISFLSLCTVSYAMSFDDWSNEDLCRWTDAEQVPDPILLEIEVRDLVCLNGPEIIETSIQETSIQETSIQETSIQETSIQETSIQETSIQEPYASEHGTVFPSPSSNNHSNKNSGSGIRFIFNYKVKL
jgi:hypothetical protein